MSPHGEHHRPSSLSSLTSQDDVALRGWPTPAASPAFEGLAGAIVEMLRPQTEADPQALLVTILAAFGNCIGRGPGFRVEGDFHATNINAIVLGATSKGRKGTSWGRVRELFRLVDEDWARERVVGGLSSGEGLLTPVRDAVWKTVAVKEKGKPTGEYVDEVDDPGVDDKRLFVMEGELAQGLKAMRREGNTLSAIVRNLWDQGDAGSLTKSSITKTTGSMVSILGHTSLGELRRELTETQAANGFANRFLFVCAKRSNILPDGGNADEGELRQFARLLTAARDQARTVTFLARDFQASELWREVYPGLSAGKPGLLGAATGRAEAQTMRLAVLYALLDGKATIEHAHLRSALALWCYCERSARYVFGDSLGDPVADEILEELRQAGPDGLTRTQIHEVFKRHKSATRIDLALRELQVSGLAVGVKESTGGRPSDRWHACEVSEESEERSAA